jgi:hypothetical protein
MRLKKSAEGVYFSSNVREENIHALDDIVSGTK